MIIRTECVFFFLSDFLFSKLSRKYLSSPLEWKAQLLRLLHMTLQIIVNKQKCFFWLCASSSAPELRLQLPDGALIWRSHTGQPQQSQVTRAKLITPPKLQKMHPRRERDPDGWLSGLCFCRTGYMEPRFSIQTSNYKGRGGEVKFLLLCDDFFFSFDASSQLKSVGKEL